MLETFCLRGESRWVPLLNQMRIFYYWEQKPSVDIRAEPFPEKRAIDLIIFLELFIPSFSICQAPCTCQAKDTLVVQRWMWPSPAKSLASDGYKADWNGWMEIPLTHNLLEPWTKGAPEEEPHLSDCCPQAKHTVMPVLWWFTKRRHPIYGLLVCMDTRNSYINYSLG